MIVMDEFGLMWKATFVVCTGIRSNYVRNHTQYQSREIDCLLTIFVFVHPLP